MKITARYASTCPCCSSVIAVGSQVEWSRGEKARHVACPAVPSVRQVSAAPARQDDDALAARGLVRVNGPRGEYVRRMTRADREEYDHAM